MRLITRIAAGALLSAAALATTVPAALAETVCNDDGYCYQVRHHHHFSFGFGVTTPNYYYYNPYYGYYGRDYYDRYYGPDNDWF